MVNTLEGQGWILRAQLSDCSDRSWESGWWPKPEQTAGVCFVSTRLQNERGIRQIDPEAKTYQAWDGDRHAGHGHPWQCCPACPITLLPPPPRAVMMATSRFYLRRLPRTGALPCILPSNSSITSWLGPAKFKLALPCPSLAPFPAHPPPCIRAVILKLQLDGITLLLQTYDGSPCPQNNHIL